jgi:hypothetical protein
LPYVLAATPNVNLFSIDTQIQTTDTGAVHLQPLLLNLGAMDLFINMLYANEKHLTMQTLTCPILVYNVDGTLNESGLIWEVADVILRSHQMHTVHHDVPREEQNDSWIVMASPPQPQS